jgi:hypothetical protein
MPHVLEITYADVRSVLLLTPWERVSSRRTRRVALDAQGRPCDTAWQTWEGLAIPPGGVAQGYEGLEGSTVPRAEVVATAADGRPLRRLPATTTRPQQLEGPVPVEDLLAHVVTKVYVVTAERLDAALRRSLQQGDMYRVAFRPRASTSDPPAFLLANASGIFLLQAAPCRVEWITQAQVVATDADTDEGGDLWDGQDWGMDWDLVPEEDAV